MEKYAIIKIQGKQYKAVEGKELLVDKISGKTPDAQVLLFVDQGTIKIGKPVLKNVALKLKIIDEMVKGDKILVTKYKSKSRYRRRMGFRPQFSKILIEKITLQKE